MSRTYFSDCFRCKECKILFKRTFEHEIHKGFCKLCYFFNPADIQIKYTNLVKECNCGRDKGQGTSIGETKEK